MTHHTQRSFEICGAFEAEEGFVLDDAAPLAAAPPTPAINAKAMALGTGGSGWFRVVSATWGPAQKKKGTLGFFGIKMDQVLGRLRMKLTGKIRELVGVSCGRMRQLHQENIPNLGVQLN